ncbi:MAG: 1,4-dihydroxy-6-naphthoate synthase [Marinilabiliales bacterium]|nr:1,4-dihydroxy-6-naphthoate synthase [Marinilabiliales bacterium]
MRLSLGFSPCPNDTFIFDAMVKGHVDTEGIQFQVLMADVEELNRRAFSSDIDITKVSYHAFAYLSDDYQLLNAGSALGFGNGPLLISKRKIYPDEVNQVTVAIPGKYTTANLLLSLAYPDLINKKEYLFSDIEEVILSGETDAGVIIHENRFTYQSKGLRKIVDLGELWEQQCGLPIPLGGIIVRRSLQEDLKKRIDRILKRSVAFAFQHPEVSLPFVRQHAQAMEESVMQQHIGLYVNDFTLDLGSKGKEAVGYLFDEGAAKGVFPKVQPGYLID